MYEKAAITFVLALKGYALLGALFAAAFVTLGVSRVDPAARGAGGLREPCRFRASIA